MPTKLETYKPAKVITLGSWYSGYRCYFTKEFHIPFAGYEFQANDTFGLYQYSLTGFSKIYVYIIQSDNFILLIYMTAEMNFSATHQLPWQECFNI